MSALLFFGLIAGGIIGVITGSTVGLIIGIACLVLVVLWVIVIVLALLFMRAAFEELIKRPEGQRKRP